MAKQDLGKKRRCASCGMKFYDFNKSPITCPSCDTEFNPDNLLKSRRGRTTKQASKAAVATDEIAEKELLPEDDAEADTDDLGDDEDLASIPAAESNGDDEEEAGMLDNDMDDDFIDGIEEEGEEEQSFAKKRLAFTNSQRYITNMK